MEGYFNTRIPLDFWIDFQDPMTVLRSFTNEDDLWEYLITRGHKTVAECIEFYHYYQRGDLLHKIRFGHFPRDDDYPNDVSLLIPYTPTEHANAPDITSDGFEIIDLVSEDESEYDTSSEISLSDLQCSEDLSDLE